MRWFLVQCAAFIVILTGHFALSSIGFYFSFGKFESLPVDRYIFSYMNSLKHLMGMSLGLLAFFVVYTVRKYFETEDNRSIKTGVITALAILLGGYLFFGIHESTPMFNYFMHVMGYFYFKVQFLMLFMVTLISISTGMVMIWRKSRLIQEH